MQTEEPVLDRCCLKDAGSSGCRMQLHTLAAAVHLLSLQAFAAARVVFEHHFSKLRGFDVYPIPNIAGLSSAVRLVISCNRIVSCSLLRCALSDLPQTVASILLGASSGLVARKIHWIFLEVLSNTGYVAARCFQPQAVRHWSSQDRRRSCRSRRTSGQRGSGVAR